MLVREKDIDKVLLVNLDSSTKRYAEFSGIEAIERFPAIDSRENWFVYKDYDLKLKPFWNWETYFAQGKGAVGCYLSHYLIWQKIIKEDIDLCLVLEDDANAEDVKNFLTTTQKKYYAHSNSIINLNKRKQFRNYMVGTESYLLDKKGAQSLVEAVNGIIEEPVDRFMGRAHYRKRIIKLIYDPCINLNYEVGGSWESSEVMTDYAPWSLKDEQGWTLSLKEQHKIIKTEHGEKWWWEKDD